MGRSTFLLALIAVAALLTAVVPAQFIYDVSPRNDIGRPIMPRSPVLRFAPLTIDRHAVTVKIEDGVATTTVRETFRNPNQVALEGTYLFALPDDAAITAFALSMGGKMVPGEVLEKDKAAAIYRDIVARALDPALLEYVGRRLFQAKVFPIPALGTTDIELAYSEALARSGAVMEYRYPLRTQGAIPTAVNQASVLVEITSKSPLRVIYSPSHPVDLVRKSDFEAKVSFEQKPCPADRDFVLTVGLGSDPVGATMLSHAEDGQQGAFALLLSPSVESKAADTVAKDVVFVADTSGSMAGEKIEQLRRALSFCLKSLNRGDRFNLISFSTEPKPWSDKLRDVTPETVDQALSFVREIKALGGTNISEALMLGVSQSQDRTRPFLVIFLTDGLPTVGTTDTESLLKEVRQKNQALTRLFVFGIGHDVNTTLLDRLAEENHGTRDYVDEREDIELKVSAFYEKVANPVLSDVKVQIEGIGADEIYPRTLPDMFRGSQLVLTGRFKGEGEAKVRLSGQVNGRPFEANYLLKVGGQSKHPELPRLWAVRKVGFLLDQIRLNGAQKELRDEVVRLGVKYGIVTPYTSFLVVEDTPTVRQPGRPGGGGLRGDAPGERGVPHNRITFGEAKDADGRSLDLGFGVPGGGADLGESMAPVREADEKLRRLGSVAGGGGTLKSDGRAAPAGPPIHENEDALLGEETRKQKVELSGKTAMPPSETAPTSGSATQSGTPAAQDRAEAGRKAARGYFSDAVSVSRQLKELREAQSEGATDAGTAIKRIGGRTFYQRHGLQVDAAALTQDPAALGAKLVKVEIFSTAYFDLLTKRPDLAPVLALGIGTLFIDGDAAYLIVAAPEAPPAPESR